MVGVSGFHSSTQELANLGLQLSNLGLQLANLGCQHYKANILYPSDMGGRIYHHIILHFTHNFQVFLWIMKWCCLENSGQQIYWRNRKTIAKLFLHACEKMYIANLSKRHFFPKKSNKF